MKHILLTLFLATALHAQQPPKDEAKQALDDAQKFAAAGEHAKALERHEWFHANALRVSQGMTGVRLSFALSYWVRLGSKYPPALDSLKKIRDENLKLLSGGKGTRQALLDVHGINRALAVSSDTVPPETIALFKELDATQPDLLKQCFSVIQHSLIKANESELYLKYAGGDPKSILSALIASREKIPTIHKGASAYSMLEYANAELTKLSAFLVQIAESKGDAALAKELQAMTAKALAASPSAASAAMPAPAPKAAAPSSPSPPKDEARQALDDARKFAAAGEYAKALERHEWFHANALRVSPSMTGVRLSFALSSWVSLGAKYPPALDSLKKIRDDSAKTLLSGAGTPALFSDLTSINQYLAKTDPTAAANTIEVFKQMDSAQPALARACFSRAEEYLVAAGETAAFKKQAGDLKRWHTTRILKHQDTVARYKGTKNEGMISYYEKKLNSLTAFLAGIATADGNPVLADELRAMTAKAVTISPPAASAVKP